ncbi:MAG: carboxymuconolactone decarboxylase family protein [Alphaproteobacteria bacterium]|nr:carboxymuconolactone decarboxylase family protein [Pseudomonadota bacterium]
MPEFTVHNRETAPEKSKPTFDEIEKTWGMVPNVFKVMAESPALMKGCWALETIFGTQSGFARIEQEVITMSANVENDCRYCMAAHTMAARMEKLPGDVIGALRGGTPIADLKLEALRRFATTMVRTRGWPTEEEVTAFLAAGYTKAQALEVILGAGLKLLTNYTNHIAHTPLDKEYEGDRWEPPKAA